MAVLQLLVDGDIECSECSSPLNYQRGEALEKKKTTGTPLSKVTNTSQDKSDQNKKISQN